MDEEQAIAVFTENQLIAEPQALEDIIKKKLDPEKIAEKARDAGVWFINQEFLVEYAKVEEKEVVVERTRKCVRSDLPDLLEINGDSDVSGQSTCRGELEDFVSYFNERYKEIGKTLKERIEFRDTVPVSSLKSLPVNGTTKIIGMVSDKRESTRYRFLELEDTQGEITVLLTPNNEKAYNEYDNVLLDDVIGVRGRMNNDLFIAEELTAPDIPLTRTPNYASEEVYAAFLSDIHVGSYLFQEKQFQSLLNWLCGSGNNQSISKKLKYIFIAGDLVDGIGIYPTQEEELVIPDIEKQYDFLAYLLEQIPKDIRVVAGMGNHDATRIAEPQPRIPEALCPRLYSLENVSVVGNPVKMSAHGVKILMYHGTSMDSVIANLSGSTYREPDKPMIEYIKRRTLAPSWGSNLIAPEDRDYLYINEVPDIFHAGHVHTNGYSKYKGVSVINSGTWQGKTKYQEQLGHQPTPCRLPVMNLSNHDVRILDFGGS
ncbi:MAG: DNA-directed DNA polymerase II small subunit [Candidatus Altiarchaeales archaeon]|nr:DNA-directed DNA polymerase II small subunit [Candidatus Altiarchaeales archaeon]